MKKNNKKILTAVATLGGSVALLVGGAFAWFSASTDATTGGDIVIGSMSVTADLKVWKPASGGGAWEDAPSDKIDISGMMPGNGRFYAIEVTHEQADLTMTLDAGIVDGGAEGFEVSKKMELYVSTVAALPDSPTLSSTEAGTLPQPGDEDANPLTNSIWTKTNDLKDAWPYTVSDASSRTTSIILLEFYFSGTAGNAFQGKTLTLSTITLAQAQVPGTVII